MFFRHSGPAFAALIAIALAVTGGPAFSQTPPAHAQQRPVVPAIVLTVNPAELKIVARAMAAHPEPQTLSLVVKLQAQIDKMFPPGGGPTELPLPAIQGVDR
jgi:hypothetical protein